MMELLWYGYRFSGRHDHELAVFDPIPADETLYLTKKPPDTLRIRKIFEADENLHVIAMQRDPRAVITSTHLLKPGVYFAGYKRWREYLEAMTPLLEHPRFLLLRYEDLVTNPAQVQSQVSERFPFLEQQRAFADYPTGANVPGYLAELSLNGVRPFDTSRIDGWQEHLERVNGQLKDHPNMVQDLIDNGYETNSDWVSMLDGVSHYHQDYKDSGPAPLRRLESNIRFWWKTRSYLRSLKS
jgi:hypothetical protein